ncbi:hypothetical protein PHMEG_00010891 [Phytophthora megakarya]|uniref:Uncharacterized protein n=1 Tax=Phytophthora megakarya TaxID=4795 RepID=A0A225WE95_9STRA|nr:hypothetical protein PHMEG_00010891 [Phytophthora megakarya]
MSVEALMVEGAADEFLLGEDWMLENGVKIDFTSCEMKWYSRDDKKIVPFSWAAGDQQPARVARVRLLRRQRVPMRTCRNVELAVVASEGTVDWYVPSPDLAPHLLLAPTVMTVRGGKVVVPVMNVVEYYQNLPSRQRLGTWIPTPDDVEVLELSGELSRASMKRWLDQVIGDNARSLSNKGELEPAR